MSPEIYRKTLIEIGFKIKGGAGYNIIRQHQINLVLRLPPAPALLH
jgi:hypothetical protein